MRFRRRFFEFSEKQITAENGIEPRCGKNAETFGNAEIFRRQNTRSHSAYKHCRKRDRRKYGKSIPVGYAFRRIWEGGHGTRSQHYAGVSFDVGQSLTRTARTAIYNAARGTGAWGYVEPLSQTPTWVHMDRRYGTPACSGTTAGYPTLRRGSRGCYVMILQDALSTLGYQTGSRIDGIFGARTEEALKGFQRRTSLRVDGVCGCNSWKKISTAVIGVGRTKTTID